MFARNVHMSKRLFKIKYEINIKDLLRHKLKLFSLSTS